MMQDGNTPPYQSNVTDPDSDDKMSSSVLEDEHIDIDELDDEIVDSDDKMSSSVLEDEHIDIDELDEEIVDLDDVTFESDSSEHEDMGDATYENDSSESDGNNLATRIAMRRNNARNRATRAVAWKDDAMCVFRGHTRRRAVFCCSFSKSGELAASGDEDDTGYVWNTSTGETVFDTGLVHDDSIIFADFNYNDKFMATADMRGKIKLWRISEKRCIWETDLMNDISWIKWHPFSDILITGIITGEVYMVQVRHDNCKVFVQGTGDKTECGVILPDGKRVAIGYQSGTIHVIDLKESTVVSTTPHDEERDHGHASAIIDLDCHMDNNLLISVSLEGQTILSTAHNGKVICILQDLCINPFNEKSSSVETATFCKDPTFPAAATGTAENDTCGIIYIWDIKKQTLRHEISQEGGVIKLIWAKTLLFSAGLDGKLRCFNAKAGHCLQIFSGHKTALYDFCLSSDEKKALTVSEDSTGRVFDISPLT